MKSATVNQPTLDPAYEVEKKLQGTWIVRVGRWNCQLHFAAHNFVLRFANGDIYLGIYTVDPTATPGAMEMTVEDGPDHYRGLTALCLYELDGETLRWRPNEPGHPDRHAEFTSAGDQRWPTLVLRRDGL
jgi:uncharacterized protein (TIGR03067 family)